MTNINTWIPLDFGTNLNTLLTDLTRDVVQLKKQAAARYRTGDDWSVVDAAIIGECYEVLLLQRPRGYYATTRFGRTDTHLHSALPDLYAALRYELLTLPALLDALNNADTEEQLRYRLSKGVRTRHSKDRGFRWDTYDKHSGSVLTKLIREDISDYLAVLVTINNADVVVGKLAATTETISVIAPDGAVIEKLPFDYCPFLSVEVLQQQDHELTGDYITELNTAIEKMYEVDEQDRVAEEREEARIRGENTDV